MPCSPLELLDAAREVRSIEHPQIASIEALTRTAINRAYYAALHSAIQISTSIELTLDGDGGSHERVFNALADYSYTLKPDDGAHLRSALEQLKKLRSRRVRADYKPQLICEAADAKVAIEVADRTMRRLAAHYPKPNSPAV